MKFISHTQVAGGGADPPSQSCGPMTHNVGKKSRGGGLSRGWHLGYFPLRHKSSEVVEKEGLISPLGDSTSQVNCVN